MAIGFRSFVVCGSGSGAPVWRQWRVHAINGSREASMTVRVLIVADAPVLRVGVAACLPPPEWAGGGEAAGAAEALTLARGQRPDLAIVELSVDAGAGLDLLRRLKSECPALPVLAWCLHHEGLFVERALRAGARGLLDRSAPPEQVRAACRQVLAGKLYLNEGLTERMLERVAGGGPARGGPAGCGDIHALTDRELDVFGLCGLGFSTVTIAGRLNLSVKTVECHREKIKRKLGLQGAAELIRRAVQWTLQPD
jgi:DNA-binding NarL/FixJ family response regulator